MFQTYRSTFQKRGWANVLGTEQHYEAITGNPGIHDEIFRSSYKSFACGLVVHAVIDGCIQLCDENKLTPDTFDRIDLAVHPIADLETESPNRTGR